MLEQLSDKANGNYFFIDSDREAYKVLVDQMQGTLVTIAKDVKLQVEFNPAQVSAYRLIGYENRRLADRDFNDDRKDAGEIGAGHSVTAIYEIVPADGDRPWARPEVDPLKYQGGARVDQEAERKSDDGARELLTLKLRYQPPSGGASKLQVFPVQDSGRGFAAASVDLQFSAAVAAFGMLLRNSQHKGNTSFAAVLETASAARGDDRKGMRREFLQVVQAAQRLAGERIGAAPVMWRPETRTFTAMQQRTTPSWTFSGAFLTGLVAGALMIMLLMGMLVVIAWAPAYVGFVSCRPAKLGRC